MTTTRVLSVAMIFALYAAGALLHACSSDEKANSDSDSYNPFSGTSSGGPKRKTPEPPGTARAKLSPMTNAGTAGTAEFVEKGAETVVTVSIENGGRMGDHGISIYENGSCEATDAGPAFAAGMHWNPTDAGHGSPTMSAHHLGDLGNVSIDMSGTGRFSYSSKEFAVRERDGGASVVGKALIFHEWVDDGLSPPLGNSGVRTACGVIEKVEAKDAKKK